MMEEKRGKFILPRALRQVPAASPLRTSHPFQSYGPRGHSFEINHSTAEAQQPIATRDEIKKRNAACRMEMTTNIPPHVAV